MKHLLLDNQPCNTAGVRTGWRVLRRASLALGLGLLGATGAQAQTAATYQFASSTTTFTPITGGTGVMDINADDAASPVMPIGFTFTYQGVAYTTFQANSNGYLGFGSGLSDTFSANLDSTDPEAPSVAAFIGDLRGDLAGATAQYVVTGTAPNQVLTMEWLNWGTYPSAANVISFQAKLYETSGRIEFVYRQEVNPFSKPIGIGLWGAPGNYLSLSDASAAPTASSTTASTFPTRPATGQLYRFEPAVQWTGAVSTNWGTAGNWANNMVPTSTTSVAISATARQPVVSGSQTSASLSLSPNTTLTLAASALLEVNGTAYLASTSTLVQQAGTDLRIGQDLANAGATFTLDPTSTVSFGTSSTATTHNITGTGTVRLQNVSVGVLVNGEVLNIQAPITVQRVFALSRDAVVNVVPGGGTTPRGSFIMLSNATATAQIVKNATSTSAVNGNVTVQRYITPTLNAGAGYRHYSAPTVGATVDSLTTVGFSPVLNTTYNTSPTPNAVTSFPNVFGYDQSRVGTITSTYGPFDQGYFSPAVGALLVQGRGYTVNISASATVNFRGSLTNGNVSVINLTRGANGQSGWQLLGNPYASVLDMGVVAAASTGLDNAVYVYQSTGQYVGQYQPYVNGVGPARYVASSQGFFMRTSSSATPGVLNVTNAARSNNTATFQRTTAETRPLVQLDLVSANGQQRDAAYVYVEAGATAGFDAQFDAYKLPAGNVPYLALTAAEDLAVNGLPVLGTADVRLPLTVGVPTTGTYTLEAARLLNLPAGKVAYLRDAQTGAVVDLAAQPRYAFAMNAAFRGPRFELVITGSRVLATAPASLTEQVALYPSVAHGAVLLELPAALRQQVLSLTLVDALGKTAKTITLPATASAEARSVSLAGVAAGVYIVRLFTMQGTVNKRLVVE